MYSTKEEGDGKTDIYRYIKKMIFGMFVKAIVAI